MMNDLGDIKTPVSFAIKLTVNLKHSHHQTDYQA